MSAHHDRATINKSRAFILTLAFVAVTAHAQVPGSIAYLAYLTDSSGNALDGSVSVAFAIYAVEVGGTPLWSETQAVIADQGFCSYYPPTLPMIMAVGVY